MDSGDAVVNISSGLGGTSQPIELQPLSPPVTGRPVVPSSLTITTQNNAPTTPSAGPVSLLPSPVPNSNISNTPTVLDTVNSIYIRFKKHSDMITTCLGALGILLAAAVVRPTLRAADDGRLSKELAEWNSEKDFIDYCESHPFVMGSCEIARNLTLPAPPGFSPTMMWKRTPEQAGTFTNLAQDLLVEAVQALALGLSVMELLRDTEYRRSLLGPLNALSFLFKIVAMQACFNIRLTTSKAFIVSHIVLAAYSFWWPFPLLLLSQIENLFSPFLFLGQSETVYVYLGKVPGPVLELTFLILLYHLYSPWPSKGLVACATAVVAKQTAAYFAVDLSEIWKQLTVEAEGSHWHTEL
ncbi:hypothetical protein QBC43DRAFT_285604 [Cladorrhinum sp. PSN259]|nr:hypothetical protein QBC43DRAFT_285604 [Cladorrhinum sp. PSN259]